MSDDPIDRRFFEFAKSGDRRLRNDLVVDNQGLAYAFSRRYRNKGVSAEDLDQVALEALVHAVDRFDPERGIRFSTFAARTIEGKLKQYFRDKTWDVRVPRSTRQLATTVQGAVAELTQQLRRTPTPQDLADHLALDLTDVTLALDASAAHRSATIDDNRDITAAGAVDDQHRIDAAVIVPALLDGLPDDERRIVELRFFANMAQSQIAAEVGVSQMQISRVLRRALGRLRGALDD